MSELRKVIGERLIPCTMVRVKDFRSHLHPVEIFLSIYLLKTRLKVLLFVCHFNWKCKTCTVILNIMLKSCFVLCFRRSVILKDFVLCLEVEVLDDYFIKAFSPPFFFSAIEKPLCFAFHFSDAFFFIYVKNFLSDNKMLFHESNSLLDESLGYRLSRCFIFNWREQMLLSWRRSWALICSLAMPTSTTLDL